MSGVPDYPVGVTLDFKFTTRQFSTGAPFAWDSGAVEVYEDNDITQITVGDTLSLEFDGVAGLHNIRLVATGGNGFEAGKSYSIVASAGTVDSVSVVGEVIQQFTLDRSAAAVDLANGTDGLGAIKAETALIVADTNELQTDDVPLLISTLDAVVDTVKAETALILTDTGTTLQGELDGIQADTEDIQTRLPAALSNGMMDSNVERWLDTAVEATTAGRPDVNTVRINNNSGATNVLSAWLSQGIGSQTADSGTTTTLVDAARTEADDHWNGSLLVFTTGANDGYTAIVTDFDAATNTITFTPAVPTAVTTEFYTLVPGLGHVDAVADAIWDLDATTHQAQGTFGQAIGDPGADADTIYGSVVTGAAGANIAVDIIAVKAETALIVADTDVIDDATSGLVKIASDVAAVKVPTDKMVFTKANEIDANTVSINDATVVGDGNASPWDGA